MSWIWGCMVLSIKVAMGWIFWMILIMIISSIISYVINKWG